MRNRGLAFLVVGLAMAMATAATSCKKTLEGETRNWERSNLRAQELSALYPGFAPAIRAQQAKAQAEMASAKGISNAEEKTRKMSECSSMLSGGFIGGLGGVESKVKGVREKAQTASSTAPGGTDQLATQTAVADAQRILASVDESLRRGAGDAIAATAILRKVDSDLADAAKSLDRVIDANKKRQEAAKATPAPGAASTAGANEAPKAVVPATWKCKYCGTTQPETSTYKCKNCGAGR